MATHIFVLKHLNQFINTLLPVIQDSDYRLHQIEYTKDIENAFQDIQAKDTIVLEWGNELAETITNNIRNSDEVKIVVRVHSYEAFNGMVEKIKWDVVDKVIFVSKYVQQYVCDLIPEIKDKSYFIPNQIDVNEFSFKNKRSNEIPKVAYVGHINFKKGGILLPHAMQQLAIVNPKTEFHVLSKIQNLRLRLFMQEFIKSNKNINIKIHEWIPQEEVNNWLEDKDYILCTSLLESQNLSVMQAMLKGIKPLIHNFVGAEYIYPKEYLWSNFEELKHMFAERKYNSLEYREFVKQYMYDNNDMKEFLK